MSLEITPAYEPQTGSWSYLLADETQSVAAIIDPVWVFNPVSGRTSTAFIDGLIELAGKKKSWVTDART